MAANGEPSSAIPENSEEVSNPMDIASFVQMCVKAEMKNYEQHMVLQIESLGGPDTQPMVGEVCAPSQQRPQVVAAEDVPAPEGEEVILPALPRQKGKRKKGPEKLPSPPRKQVSLDTISILPSSEDELVSASEEDAKQTDGEEVPTEQGERDNIPTHLGVALTNTMPTEAVATSIKENLAQLVRNLWTKPQDSTKYKEKLEKVVILENCSFMKVQKCNKGLFEKLPKESCEQDKAAQYRQKNMGCWFINQIF